MAGHLSFIVFSLIAGFLMGGCGELGQELQSQKSRRTLCSEEPSNVDLQGSWVLSGNGTRTDCVDPVHSGEVIIDTGIPMTVTQQEDSNNPGADALSLNNANGDFPDSFTMTGTVDGSCVDFETREITSAYSLSFQFSGDAVGNLIEGEFTGTGPQGCISTGTFQVRVTH